MRVLWIVAALAVAGCVSADPQVLAMQDDQTCAGYGFNPGTEKHALCRLMIDQNRQSQQAASRAAAAQSIAAGMQRASDGYAAAAARNNAMATPITCHTSNYIYGAVTRCY